MNKSLSIYKEDYYRGETFRFSVAYLRARSPQDGRAPRKAGYEPLEEQRQMIAQTARAAKTIIIAEFIDYGPTDPQYHPALDRLCTLAVETGIRTVLTAGERYLHWRKEHFDVLHHQLKQANLTLVPIHEL